MSTQFRPYQPTAPENILIEISQLADLSITQKLVNFNTVGIPLTLLVETAADLAVNSWYGKGGPEECAYIHSEISNSLDCYLADILEEYSSEQQFTDNVMFFNEFVERIESDVDEVTLLIYRHLKPLIANLEHTLDGNVESIVVEEFDRRVPYSFNIILQFTDKFDEANKHNLRMQRAERSRLRPVRGHWPSANPNQFFKPVYRRGS